MSQICLILGQSDPIWMPNLTSLKIAWRKFVIAVTWIINLDNLSRHPVSLSSYFPCGSESVEYSDRKVNKTAKSLSTRLNNACGADHKEKRALGQFSMKARTTTDCGSANVFLIGETRGGWEEINSTYLPVNLPGKLTAKLTAK